MSDERIHKHDWQSGICKTCGVERHKAESELPATSGWKHEPVTSEQAKQILACLNDIKYRMGWLIYLVILIWFLTLMRK